jgi:hypothetical protein
VCRPGPALPRSGDVTRCNVTCLLYHHKSSVTSQGLFQLFGKHLTRYDFIRNMVTVEQWMGGEAVFVQRLKHAQFQVIQHSPLCIRAASESRWLAVWRRKRLAESAKYNCLTMSLITCCCYYKVFFTLHCQRRTPYGLTMSVCTMDLQFLESILT